MYMITELSLKTINAKEKKTFLFPIKFQTIVILHYKLVYRHHSMTCKFSHKIIDRILVLCNEPTLWKTIFLFSIGIQCHLLAPLYPCYKPFPVHLVLLNLCLFKSHLEKYTFQKTIKFF